MNVYQRRISMSLISSYGFPTNEQNSTESSSFATSCPNSIFVNHSNFATNPSNYSSNYGGNEVALNQRIGQAALTKFKEDGYITSSGQRHSMFLSHECSRDSGKNRPSRPQPPPSGLFKETHFTCTIF